MKACCRCGRDRDLEDFYRRSGSKDGRGAACKECLKATERASGERMAARLQVDEGLRERVRKQGRESRRRERNKRYGLKENEYEVRLAEQGGRCATCRRSPGEAGLRYQLHVDHDHATGAVRGLLCHNCNLALGQVGDSVDLLMALASYLLASEPMKAGAA